MSRPERAERRTDWSANKAPEVYAPNWDDYMDVLEGKKISKDIPRHVHQPMFGYWRVKVYKPGTSSMEMRKAPHGYEPIAFMPWNDGIICKLGNHTSWEEFDGVCAQWEKAKLVDPITKDEYKNWIVTGKWLTTPRGADTPDDIAIVSAPDPDGTVVPMDGSAIVEPPKTHNAPPEDTPYTKALSFIQEQGRDITGWIAKLAGNKVSSQEESEKVAAYLAKCVKIRTRLEAARVETKAPHLAKCKDIDEQFKGLGTQVVDLELILKGAVREFAIAQDARIKREKQEADAIAAEQARKARQELESAEMSRTICDDAAADKHEAAAATAIAAASEARAAPAAFSAGSSGRKIKVKTVISAQINDYDAALEFFKNNDKIREIVQSLANTIIRAGGPVPGCSRDERPDV